MMSERVRKRPYVGVTNTGAAKVIKSPIRPDDSNYKVVVGPFKTQRGAEFMANNPQCRTVTEAERLARGGSHSSE